MVALTNIPWGFKIALTILFALIALIAIIRARYKKFTNREFVLRFRNGKLREQGFGGGYFILPFIDELVVLSTTVQNLNISNVENITRENQDVQIDGFVVWRIEDPEKAYQSISGSQNEGVMTEIDQTLLRLVESIIRTTVARLTLDQVLRERSLIIEAILTELVPVVAPMGIKINTAEIKHVRVADQDLFHDLQERYRQETRLNAEKVKIETDKEIGKSESKRDQEVKLFRAEQEELSRVRELEKDRTVLIEQQKLNETEQLRLRKIQELEKERESKIAELSKQKLEIEARTKLMQLELEAEASKIKQIKEKIEAEAAQKRLIAEAEADAIKLTAQAKMEATELEAQAEAYKLEKIASAKKESMLAEAEGRKALLLAEAEGLKEKVKAQGLINEAMIMEELVKQLPSIASSIKVGDVNWLQMGGSKDSDTPLGIIPKNMIQIMGLAKSFGLDLESLIATIRGQRLHDSQSKNSETYLTTISPDQLDLITNSDIPVKGLDLDGDGKIDSLDLNGDGNPDFQIPDGIIAIDTNGDGIIKGFDTDGDGEIDFTLSEILNRFK